MDFSIGEDRQMLVDTLSRFLADKFPWEVRSTAMDTEDGFSRELWSELAELGVLGALFGEEVGGFGGSSFDAAAVFGEVGRGLALGPFLGTLMGGKLLEAAGDEETLAGIIGGETILTFADEPSVNEDGSLAPDVQAAKAGDDWLLTGSKGVVGYLGAADMAVVTAKVSGGEAAFLLDLKSGGVELRDYKLVDGGAAGELILEGAEAKQLDRVGPDEIATARALGLVATCWEAVAVMEVLKDQTLDYLRTRKQFGIPIGKFQALQHRMATVALEVEQACSAAINAAARFDDDVTTRDKFCSAAKYTCGAAGRLTAEEAIQMHGGIGMTWELPLSHFAKRLTMLGQVMGDEDEHLSRFITLSSAA